MDGSPGLARGLGPPRTTTALAIGGPDQPDGAPCGHPRPLAGLGLGQEHFRRVAHRPASPAPGQISPRTAPASAEADGRRACLQAISAATSHPPIAARTVARFWWVPECAAIVQPALACVQCSGMTDRPELTSGSRRAPRSPKAAAAVDLAIARGRVP